MKSKSLSLDNVYFFIFIAVVFLGVSAGQFKLYPSEMPDERAYKEIVNNFNVEYLNTNTDTKPLTFLYIQKLLNADITKTRILNLILIFITTILIYDLTKNKLSFLFIFIPIVLMSMWLTVEIIETIFLLLCFRFPTKSGRMLGFAAIFRPYSVVYFFLLNNRQKLQFIIVCSAFILILLAAGMFFPYADRLFHYGTNERIYDEIGMIDLSVLVVFLIIGVSKYKILNQSKLWKWQLIALLPLYIKLYGHYFLTPVTLLFVGYLLNERDNPE